MAITQKVIVILLATNIAFLLFRNYKTTSECGRLYALSKKGDAGFSDIYNDTTTAPKKTSRTGEMAKKIPPASLASYQPSAVEKYLIDNGDGSLNYTGNNRKTMAAGCRIWTDPQSTPYHQTLQRFRTELKEYTRLSMAFNRTVKDLRQNIQSDDNDEDMDTHAICETLELHKDGLLGLFPSGALSEIPGAGYVEPLTPPLRSPEFCFSKSFLMDMDYLIHDWAALCRTLKKHSRTVFVDMGAALDFRHGGGASVKPAIYVTHMYQKFGFHFDHIYAYELKAKEPAAVYKQLPDDLKPAYHWYNVGVESDPNSPNNPLKMLVENFNEDDFIVVKLDIDAPFIENPLAMSVLTDERFHKLIDVFYYEHHVFLAELASNWGSSMEGSLGTSLKFFYGLREKGIASHYWP